MPPQEPSASWRSSSQRSAVPSARWCSGRTWLRSSRRRTLSRCQKKPDQLSGLRGRGTAKSRRCRGSHHNSCTPAPAGTVAVGRRLKTTVIATIVARAQEANS